MWGVQIFCNYTVSGDVESYHNGAVNLQTTGKVNNPILFWKAYFACALQFQCGFSFYSIYCNMIKAKVLQEMLEDLDGFQEPNILLEQYITPPHIAANMLNFIEVDINNKMVGDLGCGCGMLTLGADLSGAGLCIGFDIDGSALKIAQKNQAELKCHNVDFVQSDVMSLRNSRWHKAFHTIIMNPPFGTRNKGIDAEFLKTASALSRTYIYSIHKSSTIAHIEKIAVSLKLRMKSLYQLKFDLPKTYKFHDYDTRDIAVHFVRFEHLKLLKKKK